MGRQAYLAKIAFVRKAVPFYMAIQRLHYPQLTRD